MSATDAAVREVVESIYATMDSRGSDESMERLYQALAGLMLAWEEDRPEVER